MDALDLISIRALWFVLAGFVLGFTCSTLWEWLYYRGKRINNTPLTNQPTRATESPTVKSPQPQIEPIQETANSTLPPYRSSGVFLETERPPEQWAAVRTKPANNQRGEGKERQPVSPEIATMPRSQLPIPPSVQKSNKIVEEIQKIDDSAIITVAPTAPPAPLPMAPAAQTGDQSVAPLPISLPDPTPPIIIESPIAPPPVIITPHQPPTPKSNTNVTPAPADPVEPIATRLAAPTTYPDDLTMIKGIGDAYKRRLYNAGIYTWRQIAETEVDTMRTITRAKPNADLNNWREQARTLAEKYQRQQAVFQGPLDDFTQISGIGPITGDILYKAGIFTYEQLAAATAEQLAQIVPAPTIGAEIDYESWIKQAARLVNTKQRTQRLLA